MTGLPTTGRIMALDIGSRTIGVAISDETRTIGQPLLTLERPSEGIRRPIGALRRLVKEWAITEIVVGLPLTLDGEMGAQAHRAEAFAETLRHRLGLPVALQDERLTTYEADEALREDGLTPQERKQHVDAVAASLILRRYLAARAGSC